MAHPGGTDRTTRSQAKAAEQKKAEYEEAEHEEEARGDTETEMDTPEEKPQEDEEEAPTTKKKKSTKEDTVSRMDQQAMMKMFGQLLAQQTEALREQTEALKTIKDGANKPSEQSSTLKPSELYLFKPTSRQDERSARIFIERIEDARRIYKNQSEKLALLLPRCLDNEIAHSWYSALSLEDKDTLSDSINGLIRIIKRDFMGTLSELRSAASKESFNWRQGRMPTEYVDEKVGKLRIAGMSSEEDIVQRVYEGFDDVPELQAALAPYSEESLANFRKRLRALQPIHKRIHDEKVAKPKEGRTKWSSGYSSNYKANRDFEKPMEKPKAEDAPKRQRDDNAKRTNDFFFPCRRCEAKGRNPNHRQINCPLRDERKEKGYAGKEMDHSSEEESDGAPASDDRKSDNGRDGSEIMANFGVACRNCNESFPSGNQLHSHLKSFNAHAIEGAQTVLDLSTNPKGEPLECIANSIETRVTAYRNIDAESSGTFTAVIDSGFGHSAVNRELLLTLPHTVKAVKQLVIRGIGGRQIVSEMATFVFYIRGNQGVILKLKIAALIFDDLGTDLLISTDYINAWNMVIDIPRQLAIFHRSEKIRKPIAFVHLQVTRQPMVNSVIRANKDSTIPPHSVGQVALRLKHSGKADLIFTSNRPEIPDGVITATQRTVMYSNQESTPRTIKRGTILGTASSIRAGSFATSEIATEMLNGFLGQRSHDPKVNCTCTANFCTCFIHNGFQGQRADDTIPLEKAEDTSSAEKAKDPRWLEKPYQPNYRYEVPKGIVVPNVSTSTYREVHINESLPLAQQKQLRQLAKRFAVIFNDAPGMARQPEDEWLRIKVPAELEQKLKPRAPYRNAPRAKKDIDATFGENVRLGRMAPAKHSSYSLPVFVVYKYTPEGDVKKARPVVDLRPLNDVAESDAYPLPLQEDILASLAQASCISSIDFVSSFYQHFLHPDDQYRTATVSHRGLEQFCVAPMGFKNSPAHNQRTFERLFVGLLWKIVNVYVDDVNIFTKGAFEQHLRDLDTVFRRLADAGYTFKASKPYLGFQELVALGKLVSRLGYSTAEEKLQAITNWDTPRNGHDVERFIGFVGWHRHQVPYFAQRSEILQELKTGIFRAPRRQKGSPPEKPQERKNRGSKTLGDLWTSPHDTAFEDLKSAFTKADDILCHFDPTKLLYVFLDASKELGFGVAAYQLEGEEAKDPHKPLRTSLRPIIFLSKCLTPAERNYWPTDLELAGLVWAVKQLRIYIEQTKTIIYTDHRANPIIIAAKSLRTTSSLKMNTRQQGWAVFLSQYWDNMTVIYKEGRDMVVPDALSRLSMKLHSQKEIQRPQENAFLGVVLLGLNEGELERLRQEVKQEFRHLFEKFQEMPLPTPNPQRLPNRPYALFHRENSSDLVRIDAQGAEPRFVIPHSFRQPMLQAAHDDQVHGGYTRLHEALAGVWWPKMSKDILDYVHHCAECGMNKPRRVGFVPPLQPLPVPPRPFYSLTMDFITDLPAEDGHDMILVVVDRFLKRVAFETGKKAQTAEEWAKCLWDNVFCKRGYGLPNTITTDRDARFTAALWKRVFELAGTRLIYTTAYHPSADGQSERVNQELEIALRFYVDATQANWRLFLPNIEFYFNANYSSVVEQTPFQVIYGFTPATQLTLLMPEAPEQLVVERQAARDIAMEGLQLAADAMADRALRDRSFESGWARLRLSPKTYSLPSTRKFALSPRYTRTFRILEAVGKGNALRMDLPASWGVHRVINKIHLDPAPDPENDPYQRNVPPPPDHIDEQGMEQWKVEKVVGKLVNGEAISYKVRWHGYGEDDDTWEDQTAFANAQEAVQAYEEALQRSRLRGCRQADGSILYGEPRPRLRR